MLDSTLRPAKDRLLNPVARALGPRVHPNLLTLAGFAVGAACVLALLRGWQGAALALWLLNRVVDGLDGAAARVHGQQTDLGGYLDLMLDFVLYTFVPLAVVLGAGGSWTAGEERPALLWLALLLGSFYVNAASWLYLAALLEKRALGARARGEQTSVTMPAGLIEGTETIVFFSLFIALPAAAAGLFATMTVLVWVTVGQRLAWAIRALRSPG